MADLNEIKRILKQQEELARTVEANRAQLAAATRQISALQESIRRAIGSDALRAVQEQIAASAPAGQDAESASRRATLDANGGVAPGASKRHQAELGGIAKGADRVQATLRQLAPPVAPEALRAAIRQANDPGQLDAIRDALDASGAVQDVLRHLSEAQAKHLAALVERAGHLRQFHIPEPLIAQASALARKFDDLEAALSEPPAVDGAAPDPVQQFRAVADLTREADGAMKAAVQEALREIEEREWTSLAAVRSAVTEFEQLTEALPPDLADDVESPRLFLTAEADREFFDEQARKLLGISGDEFRRRWEAGEYADIVDDPEHTEVMSLAAMLPLAS